MALFSRGDGRSLRCSCGGGDCFDLRMELNEMGALTSGVTTLVVLLGLLFGARLLPPPMFDDELPGAPRCWVSREF